MQRDPRGASADGTRIKSLRNKFIHTLLLVAGIIGLSTLGIVGVMSAQSSAEHLRSVQQYIEEGIASKASDIDMVYLTGYGFPPYRGGPMFYADTVGLKNVLNSIEKFSKGYMGQVWKPAPLLVKLAKEGRTFNG